MRKIIPLCGLALALLIPRADAASNKLDLAAIVTKADAATFFGEPAKDPKIDRGEDEDGVYSTCTYYAEKMDKSIVIDVRHPAASKSSATKEFKMLNAGQGKMKAVSGLGDEAAFFDGDASTGPTRVCVLYVVKGKAFISVGMGGLDTETALAKEKEIARKLIAHL